MRVSLEPGYVLHRRPYRDSSLLLEIFSQQYGRVGLVARGVRGGKSRKAALLQPFQNVLISWVGRGELKTLTDVEPSAGNASLPGRQLANGFYVNEIMVRLLQRDDPHPQLFEHYAQSIQRLADNQNPEPALRQFEIWLLQEVGYGLQLQYEAESGEPVVAQQDYCYQPETGPVAMHSIRCDGVAVSGSTLLALSAGNLVDQTTLKEAKRLLRNVLAHHLGGRAINAREMFWQRSMIKENYEADG